jgi:adenosylcobalamin-dependent ribonucleoside-triphosphate reductase
MIKAPERGSMKMKPDHPVLINDTILSEAFKNPDGPLTSLGKFIFYSKYSRWREGMNRREYWSETSQRSVEYNINLGMAFLEERGTMTDELRHLHQRDADNLFQNQFNLKQALSGRTLWVGGTPASYANPMGNFNCSFLVLDEWRKLGELIHLGMVGTGIGFRILFADIDKLAPINNRKWKITHEPYEPKLPGDRLEHTTSVVDSKDRRAVIVIGDSKEGWREAIDALFNILTGKIKVDEIKFVYDSVRGEGERLKRFGGRAGGPDTIKRMFDKFHTILHGGLGDKYPKVTPSGRVRPIHALDLANAIGKNIVSGNVRSIAEIGLLDPTDSESIGAKSNMIGREDLNHRSVSNNSVFYQERPSDEQFDWQFDAIEYNGEPCFVNAVAARRRRADFQGVNPCVEILLADRGLCNLTTVNILAFVVNGVLDIAGMMEAFRLATRAGVRMTLPALEIEEWDRVQQRDRLLGVSMTGWQDAMDAIDMGMDLGYQATLLSKMKHTVREEADYYCMLLGVNAPKLTTCVKPEGSQSQMFGGVSNGLHVSHATHFLRRVRSSAKDPISRAVFELGWRMAAEFQDGSQHNELRNILQYLTGFDITKVGDEDGLLPKLYAYHGGKLKVKFHARRQSGAKMADIHKNARTMLGAFYDGAELGDLSVSKHESKKDWLTVKYLVSGPTYDQIFSKSTKVVVDFPQESPAKRTKSNFGAIEQLEQYRMFLNNYTEHNPSNTISVRPEEWLDVRRWVKDNWDDMLAVSFLTLFDAPYPLLPFQSTTKSEVESLRASMTDFDPTVLMKYDKGEDVEIVEAGCETGACPAR